MPIPVKCYQSTQTGAPVLNGLPGSGIALLDACLVTGFNACTIGTLTVAANVATVTTTTNHGLVAGDPVALSGAVQPVFNDEFTVIAAPSTTTFTIAVQTALTAATGSMTCKIPPLGWEKIYSDAGAFLAVYRTLDLHGSRMCLRVNDNVQGGLAMTVTLYETMSDVSTGTGSAPAVNWAKSEGAYGGGSIRPWVLVGGSRVFYFCPQYSAFMAQNNVHVFGDLPSVVPGDGYASMLIGLPNTNQGSTQGDPFFTYNNYVSGHWLARAGGQTGPAVPFFKLAAVLGSTMGLDTGAGFPNDYNNGVHLTPVLVSEQPVRRFRGVMPGLYVPLESVNTAYATGDATLRLNGRRHLAVRLMSRQSYTEAGCCFLALDEDWF